MPAGQAQAQDAKEQFFPLLAYRTGAYSPNGTPWANAKQDYIKMINARDGGINGVKITFEECETGYATDRGVECYERLKNKGPTGATLIDPQATGITFALTDKAPGDKIPLLTLGLRPGGFTGRHGVQVELPAARQLLDRRRHPDPAHRQERRRVDKLKGKKIALVYHDSPFGKEPIPLLEERAKMHGFELSKLPVTAPGVEQKSVWLQVRQQRPDYVLLWGWGVMNSTALKEAQATGYPRAKMYGVWWSGAEPDVKDIGDGAKGYNALTMQYGAGQGKVHEDIIKHVHDKGQATGPKEEIGTVLYNRGLLIQMLGIEAVRTRAGALRQGQADDRRTGPLGSGEPVARPEEARRARFRRHDAAGHHVLRGPHGIDLGARAYLGRQEVGLQLRLARGGPDRS